MIELYHLYGMETLYSARGELVLVVRHPRGSYIVPPLLSLEVATPEIQLYD